MEAGSELSATGVQLVLECPRVRALLLPAAGSPPPPWEARTGVTLGLAHAGPDVAQLTSSPLH